MLKVKKLTMLRSPMTIGSQFILSLKLKQNDGGFIYFTDVSGRPCEQLEHDMKLWWVHNEACIATLLAYSLTSDEKYWKWFEKIHIYAFGHFADKEYGEWYGYLHKDGTVSHTQKASSTGSGIKLNIASAKQITTTK